MCRLTRCGTAEPVSRDQITRRERNQRVNSFSWSADPVQAWKLYALLIHSLLKLFHQIYCIDQRTVHEFIRLPNVIRINTAKTRRSIVYHRVFFTPCLTSTVLTMVSLLRSALRNTSRTIDISCQISIPVIDEKPPDAVIFRSFF